MNKTDKSVGATVNRHRNSMVSSTDNYLEENQKRKKESESDKEDLLDRVIRKGLSGEVAFNQISE